MNKTQLIGLSALEAMHVDVFCLGPGELSLPLETNAALSADHPELRLWMPNFFHADCPPNS